MSGDNRTSLLRPICAIGVASALLFGGAAAAVAADPTVDPTETPTSVSSESPIPTATETPSPSNESTDEGTTTTTQAPVTTAPTTPSSSVPPAENSAEPSATASITAAAQKFSVSGRVSAPGNLGQIMFVWVYSAVTDQMVGWAPLAADGTYTVSGLPEGEYKVQLGIHSDYPGDLIAPVFSLWWKNAQDSAAATVVALNGNVSDINFEVPALARISGTVKGLPEGVSAAVVALPVDLEAYPATPFFPTVLVGNGPYALHGVPPVPFRVLLVIDRGEEDPLVYFHGGGTGTIINPALGQDLTGIDFDLSTQTPTTEKLEVAVPKPSAKPVGPSSTASTAVEAAAELPNTGSNGALMWVALAGLGLVGAGTASVLVSRGQRAH